MSFRKILSHTHLLHTVNFLLNDSIAKEKLDSLIQRYGVVLEWFDRGIAIDTLRNTDEILGQQGQ